MLKTYHLLNFKNVIRKDFSFPDPKPYCINGRLVYNNQIDVDPGDILNKDFLEITDSLNLDLRRVIVFCYNNRRLADIAPHVDGHMPLNPAINVVITRGVHNVEWYTLKDGRSGKQIQTNFGEDVIIFDRNDLDLLDETKDNGPYLFNTSVPHRATMVSGVEEWTVSIRFDLNEVETWESFIEKFKPWIVENR